MAIVLNHTIVPSRNPEVGARFYADVVGLHYGGRAGGFVVVQVDEELTLDFARRDTFEPHHYAFHVSEADFDAIFERIVVGGVPFGSGPHSLTDGKINRRGGGRGVYFCDPDGHVLELLTRV